jgi:hypothetical protein
LILTLQAITTWLSNSNRTLIRIASTTYTDI